MLRRPVVSVGNLAMGGRGKTPVVACVARMLLSADYRPAILSRGYARRRPVDGVVIVSDGKHLHADLDRSGDEPLMLARGLRGAIVVVSPDRALAGAVAERVLGADVHILDDGFQHRRLARDVDIAIVAGQDLSGRRVPFGSLREPPRALARADAVLIDSAATDDLEGTRQRIRSLTSAQIFTLTRRLGRPLPLEADIRSMESLGRVVAVAGIAGPERFERALRDAGFDVVRFVAFRDHHSYRRRDLSAIESVVRETRASCVLTTEKDAMRLLPLRPFPILVGAVPLEVEIAPRAEFERWLFTRLGERRH